MAETEKKRGALLTIWLVIMLIANLISAFSYLVLSSAIASAYPGIFYIYGLLSLANLAFVIFLFMWKRWPFYAFCGVAIISFIMNLAIGLGIANSLLGLAGPTILYLVMRPKWVLFE